MRTALVAAILALLWSVTPARAHRLDEFLQGTTIAVTKDQVTTQIRLTPGVAVVRKVLADIDTDGDGIISESEQRAYGQKVLRDLSLIVDGSRLPLRLVSWMFPGVEEMKAGLGEILLTFRVDVPRGGQSRKLIFENHYQQGKDAYLVNCLFPNDPDIRITAQSRNYEQSFYEVDYTQAAGADPIPTPSALETTTRKMERPSRH